MAREQFGRRLGEWWRSGGSRGVGVRGEVLLALLPTLLVLLVLGLAEELTRQGLLFASLASSAFLIYLDPEHQTNSVRTLSISQVGAALLGWSTFVLMGPGYLSAGSAVCAIILLMILLDVAHPPAVGTAMSFALRSGRISDVALFGLAVAITAALIGLARVVMWLLPRLSGARGNRATGGDRPARQPPGRD